ncbi:glutamate-rich protein 2 isoform X2 [Heterodontus francisci]|uniref:glutamate-rich protein 2 isoform X2 n=1 Tax=Heterodontus francisci TaxID=7792 RepID=UPI00355C0517
MVQIRHKEFISWTCRKIGRICSRGYVYCGAFASNGTDFFRPVGPFCRLISISSQTAHGGSTHSCWNGMFMENRSTFTMRTSHSKAHISGTYTKQSYYMQESTDHTALSYSEQKLTKPESKGSSEKQQIVNVKKQHVESKMSDHPAPSNSELKRLTKPESKRSPEKQQNMDVKKQHVASKMSEHPAASNSEMKKLANPESKKSSEKRQNLNVKKKHVEFKKSEHPAPSNTELKKLTNPESERSPEKQQNVDVKKQHVESKMSDAKNYLNSSNAKKAKAISATTVKPYNLATTSTTNRISEDSGEDDDVNEGEEGDDDVDNEGSKKEERRAPIELMGEFLKAIMDREYKLSSKLCQMILIYEPENPEAQQFKTLLEVKIQLDEAASTHQNDEEDSTESDSSDEDDSEDSNNEDSDESETSDDSSVDSSGSEEST